MARNKIKTDLFFKIILTINILYYLRGKDYEEALKKFKDEFIN